MLEMSLEMMEGREDSLESLMMKGLPISERTRHHHTVDVVKGVAEVPVLLQVVDFKLDIRWLVCISLLPSLICIKALCLQRWEGVSRVSHKYQSESMVHTIVVGRDTGRPL